ncbi:hypothetical protein ScPMuIL_015331 [Solemya velum]
MNVLEPPPRTAVKEMFNGDYALTTQVTEHETDRDHVTTGLDSLTLRCVVFESRTERSCFMKPEPLTEIYIYIKSLPAIRRIDNTGGHCLRSSAQSQEPHSSVCQTVGHTRRRGRDCGSRYNQEIRDSNTTVDWG